MIGFFAVMGFLCISSGAAIQDELHFQVFDYAADNGPSLEIKDLASYSSEHFLTDVHLYFASGPQGSWSFDPDPLKYSLYLDDSRQTYFWIGRDHPLRELRGGDTIEPYSALGSVWVQNQTDALDPRVSGWIGAGITKSVSSDVKLTAMISPIFLPTFGPSLGIDNGGNVNPARFARLPPASAVTDGVTVPILYQIEINQLASLLLHYQAILGAGVTTDQVHFDFYAYSAPDPNVVPLTNASLVLNNNSAVAKVQIDPQFPREYWAGTQVVFKNVLFKPTFEFVQNLTNYPTHIVSLTGHLGSDPHYPAEFGLLTHFQRPYSSPDLSDLLVFIQYPIRISEVLTFRTLLETTWLSMRQSFYFFNELEYLIKKGFSVTAALRILSGQDDSYFGEWRNEDSYSFGVKWAW